MFDLILVALFIKILNFIPELQETTDTQNSMLSLWSEEKPISALNSTGGYLAGSSVCYTVCARLLMWWGLSGSLRPVFRAAFQLLSVRIMPTDRADPREVGLLWELSRLPRDNPCQEKESLVSNVSGGREGVNLRADDAYDFYVVPGCELMSGKTRGREQGSLPSAFLDRVIHTEGTLPPCPSSSCSRSEDDSGPTVVRICGTQQRRLQRRGVL